MGTSKNYNIFSPFPDRPATDLDHLRITTVVLDNIRCFENIEISFTDADQTATLAVILGDNGVGKSTLLKSLALGLASPKVAPALLETSGLPWLRRGATEGRIRLEFNNGEYAQLLLNVESYGERIAQHICTENRLLHEQVLICGYGASRRAFGDKSVTEYLLKEAVSSLFNVEARLQNPELILRRLLSPDGTASAQSSEEVLGWIDGVLLLPKGSTRLGQAGLEISGPWGDFTPVGALGDGYKATLSWILDFLGWAMMRNARLLQSGVGGIVIVDEVEQHLHPYWQRKIYALLKRQFPEVQFITTTHSPLCVIGTTDLDDKDVCLVHLRRREAAVEVASGLKPPRGMRADQVLTSYLFGMETTGDDHTKYEIERLSKLISKTTLTVEEEQELSQLRESLNAKLGTGETELERRAAHLSQKVLEQETREIISSLKIKMQQIHSFPEPTRSINEPEALETPLDLEVKRQLKSLIE